MYLDAWVDRLGDKTFHSFTTPLSVEDAEVLLQACRASAQGTSTTEILQRSDITALTQRVDSLIQATPECVVEGAFVKLSFRSPKDAVIADKLKAEYYALLAAPQEGLQDASSWNTKAAEPPRDA